LIIHKSFISFMEDCVLPRHRDHSNDIRLDGEQTGGKRKAFGYFSYNGRDWKVDEDTHYRPLELAYNAFKTGQDPFVDNTTTTGKARCLVLVPEIRELQRSRAKHLYIYQA
jgi:hypothetical protein